MERESGGGDNKWGGGGAGLEPAGREVVQQSLWIAAGGKVVSKKAQPKTEENNYCLKLDGNGIR